MNFPSTSTRLLVSTRVNSVLSRQASRTYLDAFDFLVSSNESFQGVAMLKI